jgi:hypothetical protein
MQTAQKDARRFLNPVGDHHALLQYEIERRADEPRRHLEQLLGKRYQLLRGQTAVSLVHGLGQHRRLLCRLLSVLSETDNASNALADALAR